MWATRFRGEARKRMSRQSTIMGWYVVAVAASFKKLYELTNWPKLLAPEIEPCYFSRNNKQQRRDLG